MLALTCNSLCPRAHSAIYGEHNDRYLLSGKPQPEEESQLQFWLLSFITRDRGHYLAIFPQAVPLIALILANGSIIHPTHNGRKSGSLRSPIPLPARQLQGSENLKEGILL